MSAAIVYSKPAVAIRKWCCTSALAALLLSPFVRSALAARFSLSPHTPRVEKAVGDGAAKRRPGALGSRYRRQYAMERAQQHRNRLQLVSTS